MDLNISAGFGIADHANIRIDVSSRRNIGSLNEISSNLISKTKLFLSFLLGRRNLMMGTGATSAANLDIDKDGVVDTRLNLLRFYESGRAGAGLFASTRPGFALSITMTNPLSRGEITFEDERYTVKPGYLNENYDKEFLSKSVSFCLELLKNEKLSSFVDFVYSYDEMKNEPAAYVEKNVFSGYHLIGGCASVVDESFAVRGLPGLYLCDASVLEEFPASNIHSTIVLLADLFGKKLLRTELEN